MNFFVNILLLLVLLSMVILIHEAGHLIVAKLFGVYCFEFSFGMGPVLFKKKWKETQYSIRALPIGGFVSMAGEPDGDEAYPDVEVPQGRRLTEKKSWQKILIMLAGVFMNLILGWIILSFILLGAGGFRESPKAVVDQVVEGSPADIAGFQSGDKILKIEKEDGSSVKPKTFLDMQSFASSYDGIETYTVQRGDETLEFELTPEFNEESQMYMIGISAAASEVKKVNFLNCWYYGFTEVGMLVKMIMTTLSGLIFHGSGLNQLSGPVGIYQATSTYASMGFQSFMLLVAQMSINLCIFNLLPLPVLDGGQVVITLVEWATHRELNEKVKTAIMLLCWVFLIGLMVFVTWNDIARLIG